METALKLSRLLSWGRSFSREKIMKNFNRCVQICLCLLASLPIVVVAGTPNTTPAGIVSYEVGQGWVTHYFDESAKTRWFSFGEVGGHSYCIEAVQGSVSPVQLDPNLTVYWDVTGGTVYTPQGVALTNDNGSGDPYLIKGARTCFIAFAAIGASVVRSLKVSVPIASGSGDSGFIKLRVVDTTLIAHTYYAMAGYTPSAYITNLTNNSVTVSASFPVGSSNKVTTTIAPNGFGAVAPPAGSVGQGVFMFAHDGPPGALRGYAAVYDLNISGVRPVELQAR
jgi:hypothetical protein